MQDTIERNEIQVRRLRSGSAEDGRNHQIIDVAEKTIS
jgi:hypothetical protein